MQIVIDITEHNKNVIDRFVRGEECDYLSANILEDLIRGIYLGTPLSEVLEEIKGEIIRYTDKHCNNGYILCESVCEILNSHIGKEQK